VTLAGELDLEILDAVLGRLGRLLGQREGFLLRLEAILDQMELSFDVLDRLGVLAIEPLLELIEHGRKVFEQFQRLRRKLGDTTISSHLLGVLSRVVGSRSGLS